MSSLLRGLVLCALFATCAAAQTGPELVVERYDVQDRVESADELETIVTNAVGEDHWDEPASIELRDGTLIVNQTPELHGRIRDVLLRLRYHDGWRVRLETWCLELSDDLLRDLGIDFREVDHRLVLGSPARPRKVGRLEPRPRGGGQAPLFGSSLFGDVTQAVLDHGNAFFGGVRLNSAGVVSAGGANRGWALRTVILEPFQRSAIFSADDEAARRALAPGPVVTAANRQRVRLPIREGVVLDVRPTISRDRSYFTLDVGSTLTLLVGGRALGGVRDDASRTSVTLPDGGTVLLGGIRQTVLAGSTLQSNGTNRFVLLTATLVSVDRDREGR